MDIEIHKQGKGLLCIQEGRAITELLISMSFTLMLLTILVHSQIVIKQRIEKSKIEHQLQAEAAAFFHHLEREIDNTNKVSVFSGRIIFDNQGDDYDYRKSGDIIVREINGTGHIEVCFNVKSFQAQLVQQGIAIHLVLEKNKVKQEIKTVIHYYLPEGG